MLIQAERDEWYGGNRESKCDDQDSGGISMLSISPARSKAQESFYSFKQTTARSTNCTILKGVSMIIRELNEIKIVGFDAQWLVVGNHNWGAIPNDSIRVNSFMSFK